MTPSLTFSCEHAEQARLEQQRYIRDVEDRVYREIDRGCEDCKAVVVPLKSVQGRLSVAQRGAEENQFAW
ncbi:MULTISPECIES: hypothetical protein [Pseudomonas]|uniref:hypothetical protein n=1 Tax=Pseudomonas TaxID=286 RepID=UPI000760E99A|nr:MULTISPECIES: hypothetical protein [Pseudomonas]MBA6104868.1 hypothetical protein [Pseudomonas monteilii]